MKLLKASLLIVASLLTGCVSLKSYVDTSFAHTRYEDLKRSPKPLALKVNAEFLRNGQRLPKGDDEIRGSVERTLRGSGLIIPSESGADGEITVSVNNVGNVSGTAAKGFGTGLTFGLVGNTVRDGYEMTVALTLNGKSVTKTGYKHLLISTVGNATAPPGLKPTTPSAGVATIVEQMLLNALRDLQGDGLLVHRNQESAASLAEAGAPVGTANPGYW